MNLTVTALADVTLGYGYPQLESLVTSLADHYGAKQAYILEPDMKERRRLHSNERVNIVRFGSRMPPNEEIYRIEYNIQMRDFLNRVRPEVVVVVNAAVMPALLTTAHRPAVVVYYMLESLSHQLKSGGQHFMELNAMAGDYVDLIVVPEIRRARIDLHKMEWIGRPVGEIYNVSGNAPEFVGLIEDRVRDATRRVLYAGTISSASQCEYFGKLEPHYPIDLAGPTYSDDARKIVSEINSRKGDLRYLGVLTTAELNAIRPDYDYSIVMWRPHDVNNFFAAPNKFFETIAAGIPPIAAPHPQCVDIIERHGCGILMRDWSFEAFRQAIDRALAIVGTPKYEQMVRGCLRAATSELNWEAQFRRIIPLLPPVAATAQKRTSRDRKQGATNLLAARR